MGKRTMRIAYRFYEDGEKAATALDKCKEEYPDAEMVFVSVKGDELYQLGPG